MLERLSRNLSQLEKKISFKFKKKTWLHAALTHPSAQNGGLANSKNNYERLEFFGDSIINFLICEQLFETFPEASEGDLSRYRSTLVSRKILALVAKKISLHRFIMIANENPLFTCEHPKLLADSLEALIGAMYLDSGIKRVRILIHKLWHSYLNHRKILKLDPNPKSTLQEICQKHYKRLPIYEIKQEASHFVASVYIQKRLRGKGLGTSKQAAAEQAAHELILKMAKKKITLASGKGTPKA